MAGAEATRQLRDIEVSEDGDEVSIGGGEITVDDGEVTVGGETVANVTTGEDGGTVNTDDGTVVGFGPDGAGESHFMLYGLTELIDSRPDQLTVCCKQRLEIYISRRHCPPTPVG